MPEDNDGPVLRENGAKHYEAAICSEHHLVLRVAETDDGRRLWVAPCPGCIEDAEAAGYDASVDAKEDDDE